MKKQKITCIATIIVSILSLTACSFLNNSNKELGLIKKNTLTVAINPTYEPFEYIEDGKTVGFDIDLMNEIAKISDLKVEYQSMNFDALIPTIEKKKCDLAISGISINEERETLVLFSKPYYTSFQVILLPKSSTITSIEELKDKPVGAGLGTTGVPIAKEISSSNFYVDTDVALPMLTSGQLDGYVCDIDVAKKALESGNFKINDDLQISEEFAIVFNKENTALADEINNSLVEFMATEEYINLLNKYGL
ncbi:MAG: transporter substrate-binding domain-containing protein [Lachnospirales bacterium]